MYGAKADCCTMAGPALIGWTGRLEVSMAARRGWRGVSGCPEIDARVKSINDLKVARFQTGAQEGEDAWKDADSVLLILPRS